MASVRKETDSLGVVEVPADKLWGAQTQRSLEHFTIGQDLIPREMINAYAILKKAAAIANHDSKRLDDQRYKLIIQACDEILAGQHNDMFPLHVWMTGSGTQFNMNVNEVISNRCCQIAGTPLGSHAPVHPNDHANMSQSSNDNFPSAMCIAAAIGAKQRLIPAVTAMRDAISKKAKEWDDIIKIGRTHMAVATKHPAQNVGRVGHLSRVTEEAHRCLSRKAFTAAEELERYFIPVELDRWASDCAPSGISTIAMSPRPTSRARIFRRSPTIAVARVKRTRSPIGIDYLLRALSQHALSRALNDRARVPPICRRCS